MLYNFYLFLCFNCR